MLTMDFATLQRVLADGQALTDAAEAHGTLTGALCAAESYPFDQWLGELFADGRAGAETQQQLRRVFDDTRAALEAGDMQFVALLPDDEEPIKERAAALGVWCQGFLYGLGTSPIRDADDLPGNIGEIVRDLSAITQVDVDASDSDENNESSYSELVEFVRVGVQLLFDELTPYRQAPQASDSAASGSLH
jgi:uncharacterized protein YgfB (UPF0149 family)